MNIESFENTLNKSNEDNKVIYIPVMVKNLVYIIENGKEESYFVKRLFSRPRTAKPLPENELRKDRRTVLDLQLNKNQFDNYSMVNGVIALNISDKQLELLKIREFAYNLFFIKIEDIDFKYHKFNNQFILDYFKNYPDSRILLQKALQKIFNYSKEDINEDDICYALEKSTESEVVDIIKSIFPKESLVFASKPKNFVLEGDLESALILTKEYMYPLINDIHQAFLNLRYDGKSFISKNKRLSDDLYKISMDLSINQIKDIFTIIKEEPERLNEKKTFNKLLNIKTKYRCDFNSIKLLLLYNFLNNIILKETTNVLRNVLVNKFNIKLYPSKEYNENIIFRYVLNHWGCEFAKEYLQLTSLDNGTLLCESKFKDMAILQQLVNDNC